MTRRNKIALPDLLSDPFAERLPLAHVTTHYALGGRFRFESNSARLLALVDAAYARLPRQRLPGAVPTFRIRLLALPRSPDRARAEPPPITMLSGPGLLGAAGAATDAVMLSPKERSGLVLVSERTLASPYHARYELIELAVFALASRCLGLVSLHAACIGRRGRGILLMGASGAGKSTITLMSLTRGFDMLSEDSVFATPDSLLATGVPNFLHVRADSVRWLGSPRERRTVRRSPVIRRRSGVRKYELDLRSAGWALAAAPLQIVAVAFLSARKAGQSGRARRMPTDELRVRLAGAQNYAAGQAGWARFARSVCRVGGYEIERGAHPLDTVELLRTLVDRVAR